MGARGTKTILMVLTVLAVMFFAYMQFFGGGISAPVAVSTGTGSSAGTEIINLLDRLKSVKMDPQLFQSSAFTSLRDETQQINNEPVGRSDPFAPIGRSGSQLSSSQSTNASTTKATTAPSKKSGSTKTR